MIASITITDPMAALMLNTLEVGADGPERARRAALRGPRRRFQRHARLRRLLA